MRLQRKTDNGLIINPRVATSLSRIKLNRLTGQTFGILLSLALLTGCEHATEGLVYAKKPDGSQNKSILVEYTGRETDVIISSSVTIIREGAFVGHQLTSVTIPDSVTTIEDEAFKDNELTSLTIPDSVVVIGKGAFSDNELTSVILPDSLTTIGDEAFTDNEITSVIIPGSVRTISPWAFDLGVVTKRN